jgi:hypothetical protein
MGHAGAIVGGTDDTAEAKKQIMRECGIHVVDSPEIGKSKRSFRIVRYFKLKIKASHLWGFFYKKELKKTPILKNSFYRFNSNKRNDWFR